MTSKRERRVAGRRIRRRHRIARWVDAMSARLEYELQPWQRDVLIAALEGEPLFLTGGRSGVPDHRTRD